MDSPAPDAGQHLVLDIGGDVGALAIDTGPGRDGTEIEISPAGSQQRVHNVVRRRPAGPVTRYAAVFPALAAGEYTVWRNDAAPAGTVEVHGGRVAEFRLD